MPNNPIKMVFFKVVIQKCEKSKNGFFFCKNCLTLFVSGREKNAFSCTLSVFGQNILLAQNSANQETL